MAEHRGEKFVLRRKNRAVQHNCEVDVRDKHHAQGIDDRAHQLRNNSCAITFFPGVENVDETYATPCI